ncbi:MAG: helix-turn-helix domain-containing protein [Lachnospiraceae bacterium]|nr:helix-turn-helix domain-containing protein [Lachnospiraceae bacterium]
MDIIGLGLRIKKVRKQKHLTQEKLAERINVSPHYIYEIEKGLKNMSISTLIDISCALNTSTDYLLFGHKIYETNEPETDELDLLLQSLTPQRRQNLNYILAAILPYLK